MKTVKVQIQAMTCKPCETTLEQAVKRLNGVSEAKADYVNGTLAVSYRFPCDLQLLKAAVEDAGHSVTEIVME